MELFVYLAIGIWRGPNTNKQYPTLAQYGVDTECANIHTNTRYECYCLPCVLKIAKFYRQGIAKHFHKIYYRLPDTTKLSKFSQYCNTLLGYCIKIVLRKGLNKYLFEQ